MLYIDDIFIQPDNQKKGSGIAIINRLGEIALEHHCKFIEGVVYEWNDSAMSLFNKLGAKAQKQLVLYRCETDNFHEPKDFKSLLSQS